MTCDCVTKIDEALEPHNTRLGLTLVFGKTADAFPTIATEQIEKGRGKPKAKTMLPTFCPFCGVKYEPSAPMRIVPALHDEADLPEGAIHPVSEPRHE